eukprot:3977801-Pyramimonas_sp.AAC.1
MCSFASFSRPAFDLGAVPLAPVHAGVILLLRLGRQGLRRLLAPPPDLDAMQFLRQALVV